MTTDGANAGNFIVNTTGMAASLTPGNSTTFTVTYTPSATGIRTAALHIASNDSDENPFDINLTGVGSAPTFDSFDYAPAGSVLLGANGSFTFSAVKPGCTFGAPQTIPSLTQDSVIHFSGAPVPRTIKPDGTDRLRGR